MSTNTGDLLELTPRIKRGKGRTTTGSQTHAAPDSFLRWQPNTQYHGITHPRNAEAETQNVEETQQLKRGQSETGQ